MSLGNASSGSLIPVYKTEDVTNWVEGGTGVIKSTTEVALIVFGILGFIIFTAGLIQYMKEARNPDSGGGGADRFPAKWMLISGAALGSLSAIFYFMVRVMKIS